MEETELNMSVSSPSNTSNTAADQAADKPMTRPDNAHSTGVADSGRWSTKRIAMYALFVALSGNVWVVAIAANDGADAAGSYMIEIGRAHV